MKAVIFQQHGGPEVLQYTEVADPKIKANEVLIEVRACALNHLDVWVRGGLPGIKIPLPHILGNDVAGLLYSLAFFGAGFAVRPFGAAVFGRIGEAQIGRAHV